MGEAKRLDMASSMDISSPRFTPVGSVAVCGEGDAKRNTQTCSGGAGDEETEEDCEGMKDDTDLAEDVYYYILRAPQPWTVGRIYRAAIKTFTGTDRPTLHATIVVIFVIMRKTAKHVLMSSIRAGVPSPDDLAVTVHMDLSQVEFYQGRQAL